MQMRTRDGAVKNRGDVYSKLEFYNPAMKVSTQQTIKPGIAKDGGGR